MIGDQDTVLPMHANLASYHSVQYIWHVYLISFQSTSGNMDSIRFLSLLIASILFLR